MWPFKTKPKTPYEEAVEHARFLLKGSRDIWKGGVSYAKDGYTGAAKNIFAQAEEMQKKAYEALFSAKELRDPGEPEVVFPERKTPFRD